MPIMQLSKGAQQKFADEPEIQMNVQVGIDDFQTDKNRKALLILDSQVALRFDDQLRVQLEALRGSIWAAWQSSYEERVADFDAWYDELPDAPDGLRPMTPRDFEDPALILGLIFHGPIGPLPSVPVRPAYVYGHMQFYGDTEQDDVFYRL